MYDFFSCCTIVLLVSCSMCFWTRDSVLFASLQESHLSYFQSFHSFPTSYYYFCSLLQPLTRHNMDGMWLDCHSLASDFLFCLCKPLLRPAFTRLFLYVLSVCVKFLYSFELGVKSRNATIPKCFFVKQNENNLVFFLNGTNIKHFISFYFIIFWTILWILIKGYRLTLFIPDLYSGQPYCGLIFFTTFCILPDNLPDWFWHWMLLCHVIFKDTILIRIKVISCYIDIKLPMFNYY